jgi:phage antirepressor YoqD-like protein
MLEQVEGHRKQGKPRMRWLDNIKEATGLGLEDLRKQYKIGKNDIHLWKKRLGIEYGQM